MAADDKPATVLIAGREWPRIPYGRESEPQVDTHDTCADCGANPDELHASGCDVEQCPVCGLQLLACHALERHESIGSGVWDGHPWAGDPFGPPPAAP